MMIAKQLASAAMAAILGAALCLGTPGPQGGVTGELPNGSGHGTDSAKTVPASQGKSSPAPAPVPDPKSKPAVDSKSKPAAWLGIAFADAPLAQLPPEFKHPTAEGAVRVLSVIKGTSADQAGLMIDDYILAINGTPLAGRKTLLDTIHSKTVGDVVELRIGRNGQVTVQKMALSPKPEDTRALTKLLVGGPAPALEGKYYAGDIGPLAKNKGKVVVLDFWATWCGPCRSVIPALNDLAKKYKDKGVEVIGISSENLGDLQAFQAAGGQSYSLFNDISQMTTLKYQAYAYPTLVLIDRKGVIERVEVGAHPGEVMEQWIKELL